MIESPFFASTAPTVLLDTDIGHDLDDALALWAATRFIRNLAVLTNDETEDHQRAQLAREQLDRLGRHDVPVIAGRPLPGAEKSFVMDGLVTNDRPVSTDVVDYVAGACESSTQPLIWVGLGPASNFADVIVARPDLIPQLNLTMMGGWLDTYRRPDRASHNPRMDPSSFGLAMCAAHQPRLVFSTHTNVDALAITPASDLYAWLTMPQAPPEFDLIAANATRWFDRRSRRSPNDQPSSWMNDPLTLAAALGVPVVDFVTEKVRIERDARMYRDPNGCDIQVSTRIDSPTFLTWISTLLPLTATGS